MVKPLKSKYSPKFISCIYDINLVYFIFLLRFYEIYLFHFKKFYMLLTTFIISLSIIVNRFIFCYFIIISIWKSNKFNILYNNLLEHRIFYNNFIVMNNNFSIIFLKKTFYSSLMVTPSRLNYLISSKSKGYSKIIKTNFKLNLTISFYRLNSNIFLIKDFLKERLDGDINHLHINKFMFLFTLQKKLLYILKSILPLIGIGIIKKKILNKTRRYYIIDFDRNLRDLILAFTASLFKIKTRKPRYYQKQALVKRKKQRLINFIYGIIDFYNFFKTLCRHGFYTLVSLIFTLLFLNSLSIYLEYYLYFH